LRVPVCMKTGRRVPSIRSLSIALCVRLQGGMARVSVPLAVSNQRQTHALVLLSAGCPNGVQVLAQGLALRAMALTSVPRHGISSDAALHAIVSAPRSWTMAHLRIVTSVAASIASADWSECDGLCCWSSLHCLRDCLRDCCSSCLAPVVH
jgi:hypothetical protein